MALPAAVLVFKALYPHSCRVSRGMTTALGDAPKRYMTRGCKMTIYPIPGTFPQHRVQKAPVISNDQTRQRAPGHRHPYTAVVAIAAPDSPHHGSPDNCRHSPLPRKANGASSPTAPTGKLRTPHAPGQPCPASPDAGTPADWPGWGTRQASHGNDTPCPPAMPPFLLHSVCRGTCWASAWRRPRLTHR